jgi:protein gp37
VIQGGESGINKRPFELQWAYDMKRMCKESNVPYFFKQIDKVKPIPEDLQVREFPNF